MCRFSVNRRPIRPIFHRFQNVKRLQTEFNTAMPEDLNPLLLISGLHSSAERVGAREFTHKRRTGCRCPFRRGNLNSYDLCVLSNITLLRRGIIKTGD